MLFHFQFRGVAGWEAVGAGEGDGEDPIGKALAEVRGFSGGTLPAGSYQAIQSRSSITRWETFELGQDGEIVDPAEPESGSGRPDERRAASPQAPNPPSAATAGPIESSR